jgi:FKBP-type peptidyl-prolyl cis-trans isomerase
VADYLHSLWCRAVTRPKNLTMLVATAASLALAACGGGTKTAPIPSGAPGEATVTSAAITTPKPSPPTPAIKALAAQAGSDTKTKPKIPKPTGKPPTSLIEDDIVTGTGKAATSGDSVTVDYVGVSWSTGKEFDSSWKRKQTFPFTLGQGSVIRGWDQGVAGMKVGGRRMLVIPPDLAYGASGSPPSIGPNETLVFVIDLRKIG